MTKDQIIRRLKYWKPKTVDHLLQGCMFPLGYMGGGAFRDVYRIVGTEYVLKVPLWDETEECNATNITHAHREHEVYRRISRSRTHPLRMYMPEIEYHSIETGLTLMRMYEPLRRTNENLRLATRLRKLANVTLSRSYNDLYINNIGVDSNGRYVLLDLGHFTGED